MPRWSRVIVFVVAGLLLAYGLLALTASPRPPHTFFTSLPVERPLVIAHQGGNHLFPDNTPYALNALFLGALYRPPAEAVQVSERFGNLTVVTERFVRPAQRKTLHAHVLTVNDEADMRRMSALGIDALITDRPDLALALR